MTLVTHHGDSVVHLYPSCFGDKGHQFGPGLYEVSILYNVDIYSTNIHAALLLLPLCKMLPKKLLKLSRPTNTGTT